MNSSVTDDENAFLLIPVPDDETWSDVVENPLMDLNAGGYQAVITVDYASGELGKADRLSGSSKEAYGGTLSILGDAPESGLGSAGDGKSEDVAVKSFLVRSSEGAPSPEHDKKLQHSIYKDCVLEANTQRFSVALMELAAAAIKRAEKYGHQPPSAIPDIPSITFAGIAISQRKLEEDNEDIGSSPIYYVEERISDFHKLLPSQLSEPPLDLKTHADFTLSELFCAVQHVQFVETHGLAFVADFQGDGELLSDLKVLVNP